jgi:hypothetical protein
MTAHEQLIKARMGMLALAEQLQSLVKSCAVGIRKQDGSDS